VNETLQVGTNVIKRLTVRFSGDPEARRQIRTETEILRTLMGRGCPRLVDAGEDAHGPWIRMEHIASPTLLAHMRAPKTASWWVHATRACFETLARVHEAADDSGDLAIVHGDVSPANIAVAEDASIATLLDFGLASGRAWPLAMTGEFRGSVLYAAPEVARAESIDVRADLFALAASLLHAASDEPPRRQSSPAAALTAAAEEPLDTWAARTGNALPDQLANTLARCLAFDREKRPSSAREALLHMVGPAR